VVTLLTLISIAYAASVESDLLDEFEQYFLAIRCPAERQAREPSTYAAMEWALPALLAVWISKAFFDGFLKELGKDSAHQFKKLMSVAYRRLRNIPNRVYTAADLRQMADGAASESVGRACPILKLQLEVTSNSSAHTTRLSCVFPSGLSERQMQDAVDSLTARLPNIAAEQARLLDNLRASTFPLAYVYIPPRGWLPDTQLIDEQIAKAPKKTRKRKSKNA
jgi:hypothetical protein